MFSELKLLHSKGKMKTLRRLELAPAAARFIRCNDVDIDIDIAIDSTIFGGILFDTSRAHDRYVVCPQLIEDHAFI